MDKINGGAAFPDFLKDGMSLRDYFAAKALQGLLASTVEGGYEVFAEAAYKVADAMIKERNKSWHN